MPTCDTLIRNANILDGTGLPAELADVALRDGHVLAINHRLDHHADSTIEADGLTLAPGFIDTHTHDDIAILRDPTMLPKLSQGVTTVITGNCGISASPVQLHNTLPDPMNLLGEAAEFRYAAFSEYINAVNAAAPSINVAALIGHTALRNNHMDRLDRPATPAEVSAMRSQLQDALHHGALGLSTGLAYLSANAATTEEVLALAEPLASSNAVYTTHLRSETEPILEAMAEAFTIGRENHIPVIVSHIKCAGVANWGRSPEVLSAFESAQSSQPAGCDCYPYAAGSSTLDLRQVDERVRITITWSETHPEVAGKTLAEIAALWHLPQLEAARRLRPAGAIYHSISEEDMRRFLSHPATMIGSDGLPGDPRPHPRLWGTFPRVLGRYSRDEKLFTLPEAIRKMTSLPAQRFGLTNRGIIREGSHADLVLFDPSSIIDNATFEDPIQPASGISGVWVNGSLAYTAQGITGNRGGRFIPRGQITWVQ